MGTGQPSVRTIVRRVLLFAAVVLLYMGAFTLLSLVLSVTGHDPAYSAPLARAALGAGGIALVVVGSLAMRRVRRLQR